MYIEHKKTRPWHLSIDEDTELYIVIILFAISTFWEYKRGHHDIVGSAKKISWPVLESQNLVNADKRRAPSMRKVNNMLSAHCLYTS